MYYRLAGPAKQLISVFVAACPLQVNFVNQMYVCTNEYLDCVLANKLMVIQSDIVFKFEIVFSNNN